MLTAAINDTLLSNSSSGQAVDTKVNTEEFGLVMAAVQVLLMPGPSVRTQTQDESGSEKSSSTGTGSLELLTSLFPGGVTEDGAVQKPLVGLQGLNPLVATAVKDSGKDVEQMPEGVELSPGMQATQAVMAAQNQENMLSVADTVTMQSEPLPRTAQNNWQMTLVKTGPNQTVENDVKQGGAPALEQKNTAVALAGGEVKEVVSEQQAVLGASLPGSVFPTTQTENSNVFETRVEKASVADEMVRLVGKESGVNNKNTKSLKTYSPDKIEPLKSGSGTELGCAVENPPQPNPVPAGTVLSTASLAESPKGIALPDLKERLAQEIKNVLTTGKGEQQRQLQLKLEPEHLGRLVIQLFFTRDELSAHFYTGNNHVKEILEGSLQQLRDSLSQQDLRLNEALVFAGDDGGMGRSFEERNGQAWLAHNGYYNHTYRDDAQVEPVNLLTVTDSSRVNYLI